MTTLQQLSDGQVSKEVPVNENTETLSAVGIFGKRHPATSGLTWGYYGGLWSSVSIANGTVTLTGSATNYVVAHRSTGAVSVSTATTNWDDTGTYARLYKITTGASSVTAAEDHRAGSTGLFGNSGSSAVAASAVSIVDAANDFAATNVEDALAELQADAEAHVAASDPHPQYLTQAEADALYAAISSGGGDASTNTSSSVDSEVALFSGTGGKTLKRATGTGLAKLTSGVLSTASEGTDYYAPGGTDVAVADGGTGASTAAGARTNLGLVIGTDVQAYSATVSALSIAAGAVNIDCALGDYFTLALTENVTSITFSNLPGSGKGASKWIQITQDSTPRTVAWPASFKWAGASAGSVSTGSGAVDELAITTVDNGATWKATLGKGFA